MSTQTLLKWAAAAAITLSPLAVLAQSSLIESTTPTTPTTLTPLAGKSQCAQAFDEPSQEQGQAADRQAHAQAVQAARASPRPPRRTSTRPRT